MKSSFHPLSWLCLLASPLAPVRAAEGPPSVILEVAAGSHDRRASLVTCDVPDEFRDVARFQLNRVDVNQPLPIQRLPSDKRPPRLAWQLDAPLAAGQTRRYRLCALPSHNSDASTADPAQSVRVKQDADHITINVRGKPVLIYNVTSVEPPQGMPRHYRRSGHLHPVFTPTGRFVTDDFPPDHPHQHGIFFAWVRTRFDGRELDFWNQAAQQAVVKHTKVLNTGDGDVVGCFQVRLTHAALDGDQQLPVLEEDWTVCVYNRDDVHVFDIHSRQRCVAATPLTIEKYHYGGMAVRGARTWYNPLSEARKPDAQSELSGEFLTSEGRDRGNGNHTCPRWVSIYGPSQDGMATLTVMGSPDNFRAPQPVRLHPTKPYFCFAPMVTGDWRIEPGQAYESRYRFMTCDGRPDAEENERWWHDYAEPPRACVIE